ncbi:MAG: DNA polymerase III subunit alpha [Prevotellaceae bacterium]|jgi:DNA polymerase-3 subunit alpha|nr:DNA polymerase III subunit alpha [Prevotellaceae bacterium]
MSFVHLHVHTQYSILDGAAPIKKLFAKAEADGQIALAITDHGNMFGVKEFLKEAKNHPCIKPIIGCEVYVNPEGRFVKRGKEDQSANHLILLAKNMAGYHNLVKLISLGYTEGMYYKPKIDHELLEKYHEGLICTTACLAGEVQRAIAADEIGKAEKILLWHKNLFGDDYYVELQRHETKDAFADRTVFPQQQKVIGLMLELARKHNVKVIASNDVHFVNADDAEAHDRLICLNTGADLNDEKRLRYTKQEYLKTQKEMAAIFSDIPDAIANTLEIAGKIEQFSINRKTPVMPNFPLPDGFANADEYLQHLTYKGAEQNYKEIKQELRDKIDFELETIKRMGFPDYFLIVQDFIVEARKMDVRVGPGRGSAAGSIVAYCLGITTIDPLKYGLLFERFLNPDRISMPDIDIDFEDDGRAKVLRYVEEKYGKDHVSHVVTFGTMGAKSAIRDIARVQKLPLPESDRLAKTVPFRWDRRDKEGKVLPITLENCIRYVPELQEAARSSDRLMSDTLKFAQKLEGSVRSTGVHACAIIIGANNLMEHIPISIAKDKDTGEDIWVSQYEGSCIEDVGMLKMDFLGLRTLSILKDAIKNIKQRRNIEINIDSIPIDDRKTFELFSRGDTVGTFQFESDGMRKWLRELQPNRFEDLIAMNALYRPGPMDYIPDFIARKHGRANIKYDLPEMEEYLKDTYGVTVYQEQVMLLSQKLAGFTKGQADNLRKAMGKKQRKTLDEMKDDFIKGATERGHDASICDKIWKDWEAFAEYAFNKSHSTCYAWVGYQTAYLKANYPAEYMAAVLTRNLGNIDEITKFMDDCKRMGIQVKGPDVNESCGDFTVNKDGNIRFGLAGIKGVGGNAVEHIIEVRTEGGPFANMFDFMERVQMGIVNRKGMESLTLSGSFDEFKEITRAQFFVPDSKHEFFLDKFMFYSTKIQVDKLNNFNSLFGGGQADIKKPEIPTATEWSLHELLKKEKELVGMYLSAHPLDTYRLEIEHFRTHRLNDIADFLLWRNTKVAPDKAVNTKINHEKTDDETAALSEYDETGPINEEDIAAKKERENQLRQMERREIAVAGMIISAQQRYDKSNKPWMLITVEDYESSYTFRLFGKDYETYLRYYQEGLSVLIKCKMQPRWRSADNKQPEEWEVRISSISLLSNLRDNIKTISLTLPVHEITTHVIDELDFLTQQRGNTELIIKLLSPQDNIMVDLFSRRHNVLITNELLDYLQKENIKFRLG